MVGVHLQTPTHIETKTHDKGGDTTEKSQAPDDGCINVWNMLSIEEVKYNLITSDIKLVFYSSTTKIVSDFLILRKESKMFGHSHK